MEEIKTEVKEENKPVGEKRSDEISMPHLIGGFVKWFVISVVIGIVVGGVAAAFDISVEWATEYRKGHDYIIFFLPLAGIVIAKGYSLLGMENDKGTNSVLVSVREGKKLSFRMMLLIFSSTVLTHLFGGSSGREGAALQIGGSTADFICRPLKLDEKDHSVMTMCGMSAGFSALFGTPVAAALFAMEITTVGSFQYSALVPCVISAITGAMVSGSFGVKSAAFSVFGIVPFSVNAVEEMLFTILFAVLSAFLSILFCKMLHKSSELYAKYFPNAMIRAFVGGLIVVGLTLIVGTRDYNGAGMDVITRAFAGDVRYEAFLMKMIFTALTLGAGFKGGEIVPTMFVGATAGSALSMCWNEVTPSFGAAVGLASMFCGVTNCPITTLVLTVELFGSRGLPFFAVAVAVSYLLSGYDGLYGSQEILFSKLRPVKIKRMTGEKGTKK